MEGGNGMALLDQGALKVHDGLREPSLLNIGHAERLVCLGGVRGQTERFLHLSHAQA
jgi:hypothetical protein